MTADHPAVARGFDDAMRGITGCPYGVEAWSARWAKGHDYAFENGLCNLPRFGRIAKKRR